MQVAKGAIQAPQVRLFCTQLTAQGVVSPHLIYQQPTIIVASVFCRGNARLEPTTLQLIYETPHMLVFQQLGHWLDKVQSKTIPRLPGLYQDYICTARRIARLHMYCQDYIKTIYALPGQQQDHICTARTISRLYPEWPHRQCVGLVFRRSHVRDSLSAVSLVISSIAVCTTW